MQQILPLVLVILLALTGCQQKVEAPQKEVVETAKTDVQEEETETKVEESEAKTEEKEQKKPTEVKTKESYIIETFESYGLDVPSRDSWILKEEGNRTVVIIKEIRKNQRPNISKMVFKWDETNPELYFVMVNNNPVYGKES